MDKKYYTSTNWVPWLGVAFVLSTFYFGFINNLWVLMLLLFVTFLPALIVRLTLKGYFIFENNQLKYCYDRRHGRETRLAINIVDIARIQRVGKSVYIFYGKNDRLVSRVHQTDEFLQTLFKLNPRIERFD